MSDISEILLYLKNEKEFYTNKKPTITEPIRKKIYYDINYIS